MQRGVFLLGDPIGTERPIAHSAIAAMVAAGSRVAVVANRARGLKAFRRVALSAAHMPAQASEETSRVPMSRLDFNLFALIGSDRRPLPGRAAGQSGQG